MLEASFNGAAAQSATAIVEIKGSFGRLEEVRYKGYLPGFPLNLNLIYSDAAKVNEEAQAALFE